MAEDGPRSTQRCFSCVAEREPCVSISTGQYWASLLRLVGSLSDSITIFFIFFYDNDRCQLFCAAATLIQQQPATNLHTWPIVPTCLGFKPALFQLQALLWNDCQGRQKDSPAFKLGQELSFVRSSSTSHRDWVSQPPFLRREAGKNGLQGNWEWDRLWSANYSSVLELMNASFWNPCFVIRSPILGAHPNRSLNKWKSIRFLFFFCPLKEYSHLFLKAQCLIFQRDLLVWNGINNFFRYCH